MCPFWGPLVHLDSEPLHAHTATETTDVLYLVSYIVAGGSIASLDEDADFRLRGGHHQVVDIVAEGLDIRTNAMAQAVRSSSNAGGNRH